MEINNKYSLGDTVYAGGKKCVVYCISKDLNGLICYQLWNEDDNTYCWFEGWQVSYSIPKIGFWDAILKESGLEDKVE